MATRPKPGVIPAKNGRWRARPRDATGRQLDRTFDTIGEANAFVTQIESEKASGRHLDRSLGRLTVAEHVEDWLASQTAASRTVNDYRRVLNRVVDRIGDVAVTKVTPKVCRKLYAELLESYAWTTANQTLSIFGMAMSGAVEERIIVENPVSRVTRRPRRLHEDDEPITIPTPEEVAALVAVAPDRWGAFVVCGFGLGMRFGEVRGLSRDRIDFLGGVVTVDRQLVQEEGKGVYFSRTKNGRKRIVAAPATVLHTLADHLAQWPNDDPDGLVFQGQRGGRIFRSGWWDVWAQIRKDSGQPTVRFHDLRHFYVSSLLSNGASIVAVADAIGDTPEVVMSTYAHVMPNDADVVRKASEAGVLAVAKAVAKRSKTTAQPSTPKAHEG